ncbi:hypothetical protein VIGAN_05192500 [Vigna angularis var. angularis]|uniref:Integrase zinc-binding domain-containing protein n=1 Tax=Vigna angularis var. angularis TaxID=157739 RepID=A0A0S3S6I3_PHAAN|nr:hypothetical protein VIGAN_05192500 [Vigna angularis var. angularis]
MEEGHKSHFSMHPSMTKMYQDLKKSFWWSGMKRDVAQFVASCLICQKGKSRTSKTWRFVATVGDSRVEMG